MMLSLEGYGRMQLRRLRLAGGIGLSMALMASAARSYAEPDIAHDQRVYADVLKPDVKTIGVIFGTGQQGTGHGGVNPFTYHLEQILSPWYTSATVLYKHHELYISTFPGIAYSWRTSITGIYATVGGGLTVEVIGNGESEPLVALATGMGYLRCVWSRFCFGIEYRNALGQNFPWVVPILSTHWSVRGLIGVLIDF